MRFFYFLRAGVWLFLSFARAAWHFRFRAMRALDLPKDLAMDSKEKRRLKHYFYGTTFLAALMCCLRGQPRSRAEKHLFTNLSALAYSFDDLIDAFHAAGNSDILWLDNPEDFGLAADNRGLALHLLHNIYQRLPEKNMAPFRAYMHRVFNVETAGRQQLGAFKDTPSFPEQDTIQEISLLEKITAEKGGCSVLLFRSVLNHPLSETEANAFFQFGYLIQLCDDVFDLWHDRQAGITTLANTWAEQGDNDPFPFLFERQVLLTQQAFRQSSYPSRQIETTLYMIHFLTSITRVCIQHYMELKHRNGALPLENRTQMVVDMESWPNRFKAARQLFRLLP